jgi:hypothetical protein
MRNGHAHTPERVAITNQKEATRCKARLNAAGFPVTEAMIRQTHRGWSLKVEVSLDSPEAVENFLTVTRNVTLNPA